MNCINELVDVFKSDFIHIGCDEAFDVGLCATCSQKSNGGACRLLDG